MTQHQARVLDENNLADRAELDQLRADPRIEWHDMSADQRRGLESLLPPASEELLAEQERWVHYPWRERVIKLLGPNAFRRLRLDRNRNKITAAEQQEQLGKLTIGVIGLSVGHAIAHTLALEGICGELRLADFDEIELSNLNRIPASLLDLGENKAVVAARRIAEIDPYLPVVVFEDGITRSNIDQFCDGLDIIVEECDSLEIKVIVRDAAIERGLPILMETSDRGLLDVERFDLEPTRPPFHGLLGPGFDFAGVADLSPREIVPHVLKILDASELSERMRASLPEIGTTLSTWPQLAGDVQLGGASVAAAVRRIGLGLPLSSGRARVDLNQQLDQISDPAHRKGVS